MVPILSICIYSDTHNKAWRKEERLGKQRKEAKSRKTVGKDEEGERGKPGRGPAVFRLLWVSRTPTTSGGTQRGNKAPAPRLRDCGGAAPRSRRGRLPRPPATQPTHLHPHPASPRPATYFWSMPVVRAPAGRAGRRPRPRAWWQRPLARSALTSTRPCQPPGQAAARLEPTALPAPPSPAPSHRRRCSALSSAGSAAGWRRGRARREWGGRSRRGGA